MDVASGNFANIQSIFVIPSTFNACCSWFNQCADLRKWKTIWILARADGTTVYCCWGATCCQWQKCLRLQLKHALPLYLSHGSWARSFTLTITAEQPGDKWGLEASYAPVTHCHPCWLQQVGVRSANYGRKTVKRDDNYLYFLGNYGCKRCVIWVINRAAQVCDYVLRTLKLSF